MVQRLPDSGDDLIKHFSEVLGISRRWTWVVMILFIASFPAISILINEHIGTTKPRLKALVGGSIVFLFWGLLYLIYSLIRRIRRQ